MYRKVYTIVEPIPADYWGFGEPPELPVGLVVYQYTGQQFGIVTSDQIAVSVTPGQTPFYSIPRDAVEELTHLPELDDNGNPTGYARCDIDGGNVSAGSVGVNCERCLGWDDVDHDEDAA